VVTTKILPDPFGTKLPARDRMPRSTRTQYSRCGVFTVKEAISELYHELRIRHRRGAEQRRTPTKLNLVGFLDLTSLSDSDTAAVFWPILQRYNSTAVILAHSPLPSDQLVRMLRNAVREPDPSLPFYQAGSLDDHLRLPLLPARLAASMLGAFGLLAIVLAPTGVYGVMAYAVARRRREIGIRMAIGATGTQVMGLVLRRTLILLTAGATLGALAALSAGNLISPILYNVSSKDPSAFTLAQLFKPHNLRNPPSPSAV